MFKINALPFIKLTLLAILLSACTDYKEAVKVLPNELAIADDCKNTNRQFEMDCYDLISYKNTFAQLRLGLNAQMKENYEEAFKRYTIAKEKGNFYANSLLAELYNNGFGVPRDEDKVISLLKDTKNVDPIAAYKLSFYYLSKQDYGDVIELLTYAAQNGVKNAQYQLGVIYSNGEYVKADLEKANYWNYQFENDPINFIDKIYGK